MNYPTLVLHISNLLKMEGEHYELIDGRAFTLDNILIYNLFVYNIHPDATVPKITEYFEKFGKVLKVVMTAKGKCCIYYADPKDATRALEEKSHIFMDSFIRVEHCYSFRQPDGGEYSKFLSKQLKPDLNAIKTTADYKIAHESLQDSLIFNLNDDCLQQICNYLYLNDQINFALTCQRFLNIMIITSKIKYSFLDSDYLHELSQMKATIFLQIVGPQIKQLTIASSVKSYMLKCFGLFCLNVEKLEVILCDKKIEELVKMIENMPLVKELSLIYSQKLDDNFMKHLKRLKHLKTLYLKSISSITGKYIHLYNGLEKLSLNGCSLITPEYFKLICENLQNLIELDIRQCNLLRTDDYQHISKYLLKLETLRLSAHEENFHYCIVELPYLKSLEIMGYEATTEDFLKKLVEFKANQLQELRIHNASMSLDAANLITELKKLKVFVCSQLNDGALDKFSQLTELEEVKFSQCHNLTNEAVLNFLQKCFKLKHVIIEGCDCLTPELIRNLIKFLQRPQFYWQRTNRLHLDILFDLSCPEKVNEIKAMDVYPDLLKIYVYSNCLDRAYTYVSSSDSDDLDDFYDL